MAVQCKNFRSITPQEKIMKIFGRLCDQALAHGEKPEDVKAELDRWSPIVTALSNEEAEAILAANDGDA
jgi:hypothetical protein